MSNFKVGDEVIVTRNYYQAKAGSRGVVVNVDIGYLCNGVDFGSQGRWLHDLSGELKGKAGYWLPDDYLALVEESVGKDEDGVLTFVEAAQALVDGKGLQEYDPLLKKWEYKPDNSIHLGSKYRLAPRPTRVFTQGWYHYSDEKLSRQVLFFDEEGDWIDAMGVVDVDYDKIGDKLL